MKLSARIAVTEATLRRSSATLNRWVTKLPQRGNGVIKMADKAARKRLRYDPRQKPMPKALRRQSYRSHRAGLLRTHSQRQATKDAGKIAGLGKSAYHELTAALVAMVSIRGGHPDEKIAVLRPGGTFDVSILNWATGPSRSSLPMAIPTSRCRLPDCVIVFNHFVDEFKQVSITI